MGRMVFIIDVHTWDLHIFRILEWSQFGVC